MSQINKELMKGSTTLLILDLLSREDMYGYQITKILAERSDDTFLLKEGTLYPILHKLEQEQMVNCYHEETESLRKRKYYHITDRGSKLLHEKKEEWNRYSTAVNKVLLHQINISEILVQQSPLAPQERCKGVIKPNGLIGGSIIGGCEQ